MALPETNERWWKYQPRRVPQQLQLRKAMVRQEEKRPKSLQEQAEEILARPGVVTPFGLRNVTADEARIVAQYRMQEAEAGPRPQPKVVSPGQALLNVLDPVIRGVEAIAETGLAASQVATGGKLPIPGIPGLRVPITAGGKEQALARSRESLREIGQAVRGERGFTETVGGLAERQRARPFVEQLGAGAVFDLLNLLPGVGWGPEIVLGLKALKGASREAVEAAIRNAPKTAEGIRAALNSVGDRIPDVKRILSGEGGFAKLGGEGGDALQRAKRLAANETMRAHRGPVVSPISAEDLAFVKTELSQAAQAGDKEAGLLLEKLPTTPPPKPVAPVAGGLTAEEGGFARLGGKAGWRTLQPIDIRTLNHLRDKARAGTLVGTEKEHLRILEERNLQDLALQRVATTPAVEAPMPTDIRIRQYGGGFVVTGQFTGAKARQTLGHFPSRPEAQEYVASLTPPTKPVAPAAKRVAEESDALVRARLARKAGIPLTPDEETALAVAKPVRPARGGIVPSRQVAAKEPWEMTRAESPLDLPLPKGTTAFYEIWQDEAKRMYPRSKTATQLLPGDRIGGRRAKAKMDYTDALGRLYSALGDASNQRYAYPPATRDKVLARLGEALDALERYKKSFGAVDIDENFAVMRSAINNVTERVTAGIRDGTIVNDAHRFAVEQALLRGDDVPAKVRDDYPDLVTKPLPTVAEQVAPPRGGMVPSRPAEAAGGRATPPTGMATLSDAQILRGFREATKKSAEFGEKRAALPPGTSRARVTTANARWATYAESRDRYAQEWMRRYPDRPIEEAAGGVVRKEAVEDIAAAPSPAAKRAMPSPRPGVSTLQLQEYSKDYLAYIRGQGAKPVPPPGVDAGWLRRLEQGLDQFREPSTLAAQAVEEAWATGAKRPFAFDPNSTANQGRFRLLSPKAGGKYITRQSGTPGITYIVDTDVNAVQAVRFNKAQFNESQATQWWEANRGRFKFSNQAAEEAAPAPVLTPRVRRTPPPGVGAPGAAPVEAAGVAPPSPAAVPPVGPPGGRGAGGGDPPIMTSGEAVLPPPPSPGARIMGGLSDIGESIEISARPDIWRSISNQPGLRSILGALNPSAVANSPAHQAIVGRAILRDQGQQLAQAATARLNALGTQVQVFGRLTGDGLLAEGPLKGVAVNTIRTNPARYASQMTPKQREWVKVADDIERAKLDFLRENGIDVTELAFEEGGQYAGRRVFAKITQNGEMVDAGFVGAGPGRPGAKLAAEKHRIFKTAEEAIAQGYRYIPDDEALFLGVQGAYNRVADKKMADWLLLKVPWRTTAASEELKVAAYAANQKLWRSRQLLAALNRAVRGERLPPSTLRSIEAAYPEQADALKTLVVKLQQPRPRTASAVQRLDTQARGLIADAQTEYAQAVSARARARERAMTTTFEEARIQAPAFAGKIFTGPEAKETARVLRESMEPSFNRVLGAINQGNAVSRYFQLAGDVSPMTIQLLYLAGANPRAYAGAGKGFVRSLLDTTFQARYLAKPENQAIMQKYPGLILTRGGVTEFTEAMARGGLLRRGPLKLAGKVLEPFQRGFEGALDVAGIEWAKALDHLGTDAARRSDLEQFINEFRGLTSSARLGVSLGMRQAETAVLLAPRYNRAIAALLFDTVHGGLRGQLARRSLAQGVAAIVATSVVISWARGESEEEILRHLNPASPDFMTWKVGGQNIGPGSKLRSVIRLFALSAKDPSRLLDTSVGWGELEYMKNPIIKFGRGLSSPFVSKSWDLITGKDYIGDPTRDSLLTFTKTVASTFMLIWTQTVAFEGGDIGGRVTRGVAEFSGGRAYPRNLLWEVSEAWRGDLQPYYDIPTGPLEPGQPSRTQYRNLHPDVDAKLFIKGAVSSLQTNLAVTLAAQYIKSAGLNPDDVRGIKDRKDTIAEYRKAGRVPPKSPEVDNLIRFLGQQPAAPARPAGISPTPTPVPGGTPSGRHPKPLPVGAR